MASVLEGKPHRANVAIFGGPTTHTEAPFNDETFEVWTLNDLFEVLPRWDRVFQLHGRDTIDVYVTRDKQRPYLPVLQGMGCPIYMKERQADIPNSVAYPLTEAIGALGAYFTSTVSYMIALAILEGFATIHLYGVTVTAGSEYEHQRAAIEYLLGVAVGRGTTVYVHGESDLLKTASLYGFLSPVDQASSVRRFPPESAGVTK